MMNWWKKLSRKKKLNHLQKRKNRNLFQVRKLWPSREEKDTISTRKKDHSFQKKKETQFYHKNRNLNTLTRKKLSLIQKKTRPAQEKRKETQLSLSQKKKLSWENQAPHPQEKNNSGEKSKTQPSHKKKHITLSREKLNSLSLFRETELLSSEEKCEQNTHSYSMCRCAQCVSTYTAQYDHISSREHAWLKSAQLRIARSGVLKTVCHPRVMSRSLPRLTLTTSTSSLSPASSVFPPFSPSQSCPIQIYPATIHGGVADPLKIPSPTGHEPKVIQSNDLEPGRTELDRNLGSDLHQTLERIYERWLSKSCHWRYGRIWTSWCRDALHPIKDTLRLLKTRILKMENYENAGFTTVYTRARRKYWFFSKTHGFGETRSRGNTEETGQVHNVLKLITQEEKAWCHVPLKTRERQGDLMQYFRQRAMNGDSSSRLIFSSMLIRQNWEDLFWRAIKIICSVRQDLNWWSKNIKSDLSKAVSMSCSNKLTLKDRNWNYMIPIMEFFLNLEEKKPDYKKNYLWRKKCFERLKYESYTRWEK